MDKVEQDTYLKNLWNKLGGLIHETEMQYASALENGKPGIQKFLKKSLHFFLINGTPSMGDVLQSLDAQYAQAKMDNELDNFEKIKTLQLAVFKFNNDDFFEGTDRAAHPEMFAHLEDQYLITEERLYAFLLGLIIIARHKRLDHLFRKDDIEKVNREYVVLHSIVRLQPRELQRKKIEKLTSKYNLSEPHSTEISLYNRYRDYLGTAKRPDEYMTKTSLGGVRKKLRRSKSRSRSISKRRRGKKSLRSKSRSKSRSRKNLLKRVCKALSRSRSRSRRSRSQRRR